MMAPGKGVDWSSPPLFNFRATRVRLVEVLGEPDGVDLDSNGLGSFDAWVVRAACGLEIVVWRFHLRPDGTGAVAADHELTNGEVHANARDLEHIRFHLPFEIEHFSECAPGRMIEAPRAWRLVRQDDHGLRYVIATFTSGCEAEAALRTFEGRSHKQTYSIEAR
ncbi:hypothetical protein LVJ94_01710 [Pendulispora rubella]|uniref:Uncharacterized protein n=1 Tax=Pendulispora rubella TaxID=2741070 RepID=A0ABZ2L6J9_9BACT